MQYEGTVWIVSRAAVWISVGVLLGWFLDQARRLLQDLAHHQEFSLDMFVTSNFAGRVTRVSPSVTRVLGYSREEYLARPFLEQIHPDDIEPTQAAVARQAEGEEILNFQNRHRAKDGTYRWLEWTSRPDLEAGEMLAVARDVTERKESEARERAYQERLEQAVHERTTRARADDARARRIPPRDADAARARRRVSRRRHPGPHLPGRGHGRPDRSRARPRGARQ